jgi:hypothetical protein
MRFLDSAQRLEAEAKPDLADLKRGLLRLVNSDMPRYSLLVLAVVLLATSGCVAAIVGAGAGYTYSHLKKNHSPYKQGVTAEPANSAYPPKGVKLLPAPGEFVDCKLKDGLHYAMSADDCKAQGGTTS